MFNLTQNALAQVLCVIVLIATVLGLVGVWFPHYFRDEIAWKLVWTFVVISIGVAVTTGIFQYLGK